MEPLLRQPVSNNEHSESGLLHQPSYDLDLDSLLAASDFAPDDDTLLPKDTTSSLSAYTSLPLPHSLPVPTPGHPSSTPSTSGGSSGTARTGTGGVNATDSNQFPNGALPSAPNGAAPGGKARATKATAVKRRKLRPKDKLDSLQKQLDGVLQQVQALTLVNEALHRKNAVLSGFLRCSQHVEQLAAEAYLQRDAYHLNPAGPHTDNVAAVFAKLTPEGFMATYNGFLADATRWVVQAGELDEVLSEEATRQLALINDRLLDYMTVCGTLRADLAKQLKERELEQFKSRAVNEEEHWLGVLHTLQLQPEQEARMLLARDFFIRCMERLQQERAGLGDALLTDASDLGSSDRHHMGTESEALLERVMRSMSKSHNMAMVLGHWLFSHTLTPLQTAKAALHSHPIMPKAIMVLNILAHDVQRRSSGGGPGPRALAKQVAPQQRQQEQLQPQRRQQQQQQQLQEQEQQKLQEQQLQPQQQQQQEPQGRGWQASMQHAATVS